MQLKATERQKDLVFSQRSVLRIANEKLYKKNTLQENKPKK
jgi:hypothetical protein